MVLGGSNTASDKFRCDQKSSDPNPLSLTLSCHSAASHVVSRAGASQRVECATFREANNWTRW